MAKPFYMVLITLTKVAVLGVRVDQSDVSLTKEEGKSAFISCRVSDLRTTYIHWYQQKDGEPLKRILYISEAGGGVITDPNHPEANEFTVKPDKRISAFDLRVKTVKKSLAAVYYCACWESGGRKIFGSGTRLYVEDAKPKKPVVLAYPIVSSKEDDKRILLCQASGMFPDLVRWEWKRKGKTGGGNAMVVPEADDELLEQRDEGQENRVTSMLIINQQKAADNNYTCKAKHEAVLGEESTVQVDMAVRHEADTGPVSTCAPPQGDQHNHVQGSLGRSQSLNLLRLTYVVLVLKNLLYFCFVSVLLYKRSAGNKESS